MRRAHATFKKKHDLIPASHTNKLTLDFLHEAQAIYEKANGKFPWAGFGDIKKSHFYFSKDRTLKLLDFETVSTELPQVFDLISMFNLLPSSVLWNKNKWLILCYSYHCGLNFKNTRYSFREESYKQIFELGEKLSTSLKKEHPL